MFPKRTLHKTIKNVLIRGLLTTFGSLVTFCSSGMTIVDIFFKRFYLFIHEKQRERERQRHWQREKQTPCREPDAGLDPGSPGSGPWLKAALNC